MASNNNDTPSWKPIVDAVRDYYIFLAADLGALPADCIFEPPVGGWPSITQASLAGLEKTDPVIDVLRHLPYIKSSDSRNTDIAFNTRAIDYRKIAAHKVAPGTRWEWLHLGNEDFPPHVFLLTDEGGDYYGSLVVVDTERGTATDYQPQAPLKDGMPDSDTMEEWWRHHETLPIAEFFASWFRTLEWVVNPFDSEHGMLLRYNRATDEVRQIYHDHGWPDNFCREECHVALEEWDRTIGERLSVPGHNLHEITRKPPAKPQWFSDDDERSNEDEDDDKDKNEHTENEIRDAIDGSEAN
ncbi:unnamed protein product [Zymoseptoria tritici ST99CH_3D1]|uniref:Uncharacterized protein n=1 Tax=Zymoseptoria tritici (strain ST99CH_3D7) TaxID=1276538 RepID=A0A1X7RLY2_ZYMT9|nr:unnamed protein product [Zymoseptoria tritici ST99CH_3D7]SMR49442.1 unnamed protein product [Zymoseptoria tritici ST99CH_3D1]